MVSDPAPTSEEKLDVIIQKLDAIDSLSGTFAREGMKTRQTICVVYSLLGALILLIFVTGILWMALHHV